MSLCECGCGLPAPIVAQTRLERGQRRGEYARFVLGHARRGRTTPILDRIRAHEALVDLGYSTPCLVQTSGLLLSGYGQVTEREPGEKRRTRRTHIVVWEAAYGPVPEGFELDHLCHPVDGSCTGGVTCPHRACHELEHLVLATILSNRQRTVRNALAGGRS